MKKLLITSILAVLTATAHAEVAGVAEGAGYFFMMDDTARAPNGMLLVRVFDHDGNQLGIGGYTGNAGQYTVYNAAGYHVVLHDSPIARRQLRDALDYRCRGDSGDDPKTQRACQLRDKLDR